MSPQHLISLLSCHHLGAPAPAVSPLLIFPRVALPLAGPSAFFAARSQGLPCAAGVCSEKSLLLGIFLGPTCPLKRSESAFSAWFFLRTCTCSLSAHWILQGTCLVKSGVKNQTCCACELSIGCFEQLGTSATRVFPFRPPCFHPPPPGQVHVPVRPPSKVSPNSSSPPASSKSKLSEHTSFLRSVGM